MTVVSHSTEIAVLDSGDFDGAATDDVVFATSSAVDERSGCAVGRIGPGDHEVVCEVDCADVWLRHDCSSEGWVLCFIVSIKKS
jgi:hypothetical protein